MFILVLELATDNNYLKRMTMLFCINELCQAFSKTEIEQLLLPTIIKLSEDTVPNVRFNVAKTLGQINIEAKVMEEKVSLISTNVSGKWFTRVGSKLPNSDNRLNRLSICPSLRYIIYTVYIIRVRKRKD